MSLKLTDPVELIAGVGPKTGAALGNLGIESVADLLTHYPSRYDDFSKTTPLSEIMIAEQVTVTGEIEKINNRRAWKRNMTIQEGWIKDGTERLRIVWFNQPYVTKNLPPGTKVFLSGKISTGKRGVYIQSPAYEKVQASTSAQTHTGRITPVYPLTRGLTQRQIRYWIKQALPLATQLKDLLPDTIVKQQKLSSYHLAVKEVHFPTTDKKLQEARQRLAFEEIFTIQLYTQQVKELLKKQKSFPIPTDNALMRSYTSQLPYELTDDQKKTLWEVLQDMEKKHPMNRLIEGDVGSGKTAVAAGALLNTVRGGVQTALIAPTEILARQHFKTLRLLLAPFQLSIGLLVGGEARFINKRATRDQMLRELEIGTVDLIIGTHALLQPDVKFHQLGLFIVDEQHRFGVEQRRLLKEKVPRRFPHLLSMTATPIPRTMALAVYGDLDLSLIKTLPKNRKPVETHLITEADAKKDMYDFVQTRIKAGEQVFVVCPLIEDSEKLETKSVESVVELLRKEGLPKARIETLHGRMKSPQKESIMQDFMNKQFDVLVATSVVEVGVDVPNATIMLIEGAERFGLAQLHQFRGRVGRSDMQSYCYLVPTKKPTGESKTRLNAMTTSNDGFALAETDLELRGPGEVFGTRQHGLPELKFANLSDVTLLKRAKKSVDLLLQEDPLLTKHKRLKTSIERKIKKIHLE
ncbi:ATP-dependent DNA helicase RecG [Patescibacteria group bacterium]